MKDYVKYGAYTKEVIKHFRNPRNMGRIEKSDGVGKVGNPICLLPKEKIHLNDEIRPIEIATTGEKVLSYDGIYNTINAVSKRDYNGKIVIMKNQLGDIKLTPEHLVFAIKIPKSDKFLRTKHRKELIPSWYHVNQLKRGDISLFPILKEVKDIKSLEINIPKAKYDFKSKKIPKKIPLNDDFLRLSGYFLSEGHVIDKRCKTFIQIVLNIKEEDIVKDIKKITKKLFNIDIKIKKIPNRKTTSVYIYSAILARFFKKLFGNYTDKKKIPHFMMLLPPKKQKSLVYGLWKGDGYVNLDRNGPRGGYSTISYQLAQQIKTLLLRQKIIPSMYQEPEKIKNGVRHRKSYRIHVGQRDSLIKLCSILGVKYNPKSYSSEKAWLDNNYLYTRISKILSNMCNGKVYNLEVNNARSFASEAFCVHNCGDVMWVYIKVKKDKKGKEKIDNIKFETFGCIAAIATSSMITDLAKGKTLQEAVKLTRDSVAKSLGGLPPIKMHCSNLAADALHEAIYNYYKKSNQRIPEQLEKEHERIERMSKLPHELHTH